MSDLNGKTAFITGGGSGIGRASAVKLARQGANICLADINEEDAARTKEEIESAGGKAVIAAADVSEPDDIKSAYEQAVSAFGGIDIIFVNAGINGVVAPIEDLEPDEWDTTIKTNLRSTFLTVKYAIPHMKKNGGSIIITSSVNGNRIFKNIGMSAYSSTKAAQSAFAKMAALELASYDIRVNVICPGAIETNIGSNTHPKEEKLDKVNIPVKYPEGNQPLEEKPGSPDQVADLVLFLASPASAHITGTDMYIDGAESLL